MPNCAKPDRRIFLKASSMAMAGAWAASAPWTSSVARSENALQLQPFNYSDVQLLHGPLKQQFDENHNFFLQLDEDRLLKVFRQVAGQPAPGEDMGGWYDIGGFDLAHHSFHGFVPGHSFGQYVSALARAYAATGSKHTQAKVQRLVRGYAETLDENATFFKGYRLPAYTYDKLSCGLMDAHEFAADPIALDVHEKLTRAVLKYLPEKALSRAEQRARPHKDESYTWDESYTLPENLFLAYRRSGKPFYRDLAVRYLEDDTYFGPLAAGENVLPGEHAYSHMNALSSAMQAYLVIASEKHLRAASNAFEMIAAQSYATGGWGPNEAFVVPGKGMLGESLAKTHASFETPCGAYAHMKITRYLLGVTGDARYGDSMERVIYNTVLGAKPIQSDGRSFYYSDYGETGKKTYHSDPWPCCSGTLPQVAADYHTSIYFRSHDSIAVNLFVPSSVRWTNGSVSCKLTQETQYPLSNSLAMKITVSRRLMFALRIRIPAWAGENASVRVNGKKIPLQRDSGGFAAITREWKNNDRVELEFAASLKLEAVDPQHPGLVAVMHGPLVLFAIAEHQPIFEKSALLNIRRQSNSAEEWIAMSSNGEPVKFRPFPSIDNESYSTYVKLKV